MDITSLKYTATQKSLTLSSRRQYKLVDIASMKYIASQKSLTLSSRRQYKPVDIASMQYIASLKSLTLSVPRQYKPMDIASIRVSLFLPLDSVNRWICHIASLKSLTLSAPRQYKPVDISHRITEEFNSFCPQTVGGRVPGARVGGLHALGESVRGRGTRQHHLH